MARLTTATGVTVSVSDDKAERLVSSGNYEKAAAKRSSSKSDSK